MDIFEKQKEIKKFCADNNMETEIEFRVLDLVSEAGELSKEILKSSNYGKSKIELTPNMESEFGDVLFSLMASANCMNINLEKALNAVLKKYKKRLIKGSTGSEND
ncbi:MAG: MazG-like family protein [Rhodothermaceae bacterium]